MKRKAAKGEFFYLQQKKKQEIFKTILFFGISAAIFIMGYISTGGDKANLLTVVAVLGCLPASKSAVSMIMHLRAKGCSYDTFALILREFGNDFGSYNLYFTSYDKNYDISHLLIKGLTVVALTENLKTEEAGFEEHIKTILKQDGITGYNVKLYKDPQKYVNRIEQMLALENEKGREDDVIKTLYSVSL